MPAVFLVSIFGFAGNLTVTSVLPIVAIVEVAFQAKVAALLVTAWCAVKTVPKSTTPLVGFLDVPLIFTAVTVPMFLV